MKYDLNISIPQNVQYILDILQTNKHQSYIVGGCIRDCLLGLVPVDWDIATDALPQEVKKLFPKTVDTGIKHGTVTVLIAGSGYEITTYRVDGDYIDFRKPESVSFTS
jgi:tRNA nucleotidyltransferase (CCA-adding enzyme)